MKKMTLPALILGMILGLLLQAGSAQAQATRTWVSGVGDDANPCSRTAPCKTFAGAISKTAVAGEINCLDPGGFGALTITKSIVISCEMGTAGVLVSGTNGIIINAAVTDTVFLRGLDFEGINSGLSGILILSAGNVTVEKCLIRGFIASGGGGGIFLNPSNAAGNPIQLTVSDTIISDNPTGAPGAGILVKASANNVSKVVLNRVLSRNNVFGFKADGTGTGGGVIQMTIHDSQAVENSINGMVGTTSVGGAGIIMTIDSSVASHNAAGFGVIADGAGTTIRVGSSSIAGNSTGVGTSNSGNLFSYKNNQINGNTTDGTGTAVSLN